MRESDERLRECESRREGSKREGVKGGRKEDKI